MKSIDIWRNILIMLSLTRHVSSKVSLRNSSSHQSHQEANSWAVDLFENSVDVAFKGTVRGFDLDDCPQISSHRKLEDIIAEVFALWPSARAPQPETSHPLWSTMDSIHISPNSGWITCFMYQYIYDQDRNGMPPLHDSLNKVNIKHEYSVRSKEYSHNIGLTSNVV